MAQFWLGTGVLAGQLNQMFPFADSTGMQVKVMSGKAWIQGHYFEDDAQETIAIAAADPTNPRIDRLVLRADFTLNTVDYVILQGTPAVTPVVPALTTSTSRWEIPIAQVLVSAAAGTIAATRITDERPFVQNANAPDGPLVNLFTNPGIEVWQRGNGPFTTHLGFGPDRWQVRVAAGTTSVARDTANADLVTGYCAAVTTTAPTGVGNGIFQVIDCGTDQPGVRGRTLAASVRVKCSQASSVKLILVGDKASTIATTYASAFHSGSGAYETLTATIPLPAAATGVTAWVVGAVAGTWYVDSAVLVVGLAAPTYAPVPAADDLARCLRYYEIRSGAATEGDIYVCAGQATSTTTAIFPLQYEVPKAVTPTVTVTAANTFFVTAAAGANTVASAIAAGSISRRGCLLSASVAAGLVAGSAALLGHQTTTALVQIEANP